MQTSEGRIVHYVLFYDDLTPDKKHNVGQIRPAIIVDSWHGSELINVTVFLDGANDGAPFPALKHLSSVEHDENGRPGTWHWPPRT